MNADLFFRFNPMPGNLHVIERDGPYTLTLADAGHYVLWRYDQPVAHGSRETCYAARY